MDSSLVTQPQLVGPTKAVLKAIRAEIKSRKLTPLDRRMPAVSAALAAEPIAVPGLNQGLFYPPAPAAPRGAALAPSPSATARNRPRMGKLTCLVLLVDFPDNEGKRPAGDFRSMLFSEKTHSTGSMRDFYRENSCGQLDLEGTVTDWIRLPKSYAEYTGGKSGMGTYPENAQKMVEDALAEAVKKVNFKDFDSDGDGYLDGLFIVHAGGGAEADTDPLTRPNRIWSHQWNIPTPIVSNGVAAYAYCTEPEDGKVGVFCHEFGHMQEQKVRREEPAELEQQHR